MSKCNIGLEHDEEHEVRDKRQLDTHGELIERSKSKVDAHKMHFDETVEQKWNN